jgi:hypothetical protein
MANRTIKIYGLNHDASTSLTVSWDGAQVYNGTLSAAVADYDDTWDVTTDVADQVELFEFTFDNADDTAESNHSLSVSVGSGSCSIGTIYDISNNDNANYDTYPAGGKPPVIDIGGKWYWNAGQFGIYHDGTEANATQANSVINANTFAINGTAVDLPDTADAGYAWDGYCFHLINGDVFTATVRVAETLVTNPHPGKHWGYQP